MFTITSGKRPKTKAFTTISRFHEENNHKKRKEIGTIAQKVSVSPCFFSSKVLFSNCRQDLIESIEGGFSDGR